uniref:Uncharacterized protein n=1 Tax=Kalanchoe fedtschenkoi TaxID=63787 RepID=A0A7N0U9G0_KALFE
MLLYMATSQQELLLPLISTSHQSFSNRRRRRPDITFRGLALLIFTGLLSVWAAIESSKGVAVTVLKADGSLPGAQRFNLMYVSNGKAARILIRATRFVETHTPLPGPNGLRGVTLRLSGQNTSSSLVEAAESRNDGREFVLSLNPALLLKLSERKADADVEAALLRSVARVRLWSLVGRMGPGSASRAVEEMEEFVVFKASKARAIDTGFFHNLIG